MPISNPVSPLDAALAGVGERWALLVVDALMTGSKRFNELIEELPGIAPNILSQRLKHLEHVGVIIARLYSERSSRFTYELTAAGKELAGVLRLLAQWGAGHSSESEGVTHRLCGTQLEARWYCPTCADTVQDGTEDDVHSI